MTKRIFVILQFAQDFVPSSYLGIPFFMGTNNKIYWNPIIQRIKSRTMAWKNQWLCHCDKL